MTLDLVEHDANQDDQEDAAEGAAEGDQDDDTVRVVTACAGRLVMIETRRREHELTVLAKRVFVLADELRDAAWLIRPSR